MRVRTYELVDSGGQQKLERFADYLLIRPSSQAVWERAVPQAWGDADAAFVRDASGNGKWQGRRTLPRQWAMELAELTWTLRPNNFGHLGIFPEHTACWRWIREQIGHAPGETTVLNLFGYTGGGTLAAAAAGARVCHVDASKSSVSQARENAALSGLTDRPVRWIVDDVSRFVERELRRGHRYDGILLDPPSFGRGTRGEVWKIDDELPTLLEKCRQLLARDPVFFLLSSHSPGYTPLVLRNMIAPVIPGTPRHGELVIEETHGRPLPSGAYARWGREPETSSRSGDGSA